MKDIFYNMASPSDESFQKCVEKLVCHILKRPSETLKLECEHAFELLNCSIKSYEKDEFAVCEKIKKKFIFDGRAKDAINFGILHRKLQTSSVLKNRASVLNVLYALYGSDLEKPILNPLSNDLSRNVETNLGLTCDVIKKIKSHASSIDIVEKNRIPDNLMFDIFTQQMANKPALIKNQSESSVRAAHVSTFYNSDRQNIQFSSKRESTIEKALLARSDESNLGSICCTSANLRPLLKDILYAIQGLKGDIIHWEPEKNNFHITFKENIPNPVKRMILRFMELGWMYCRIDNYCKSQSNEKSSGLISQSFVAALKAKLVDYYKLIAELEALLTQESVLDQIYDASNSLTLHRLSVWVFEPHTQLKILSSVVDACKGKKGGALVSVLYSHLQHGDQFVRSLIQNLLCDATRPLFKMLSNWIYCGELDDAFAEFFVATNCTGPEVNLWQDKYCLNKAMIPSFITMDQAKKILSTGKAINFLHQVCQDNTFVRDDERRIKALELMSTESLFSQDKDANFENILEKNYVKTSKTVLQVLHDKYNLMDHLLAMRNYFLLGQGDFIRHLMDLLALDLAKPGKNLYIHNLTGILESAIRATNAQFHNPEVLQRLDVRLLEVHIGDVGWDVFALDYHVDGPIGTVFTTESIRAYYRLFNALWRTKRMEYILSKISHSRSMYLKWQARIPEVIPVLFQCHILLSQMVHFVQQFQYYTAFEVMECCWADLLAKISLAQDLDQVIAAHENFLDTLLTRALLDEESFFFRTHLKLIYDIIIEFDQLQESYWEEVRVACEKLDEMNERIKINTGKAGWGITEQQKLEYTKPLKHVQEQSKKVRSQLKVLNGRYESLVQKLLIMLNDQDDPNLRFLSFRLDFNEHFKRKNKLLQSSLTYQNRRKSFHTK